MLREYVTKFALYAGLLATCPSVYATVFFTVNSTADEVDNDLTDAFCLTAAGTCTLRAAIMQANHINLPVSITIPPGTYVITIPSSNPYPVDERSRGFYLFTASQTTITGAGALSTIIDGNGLDTVFTVTGPLAIRGVTIRGGYVTNDYSTDPYHVNGAIYSTNSLSLDDCIVSNNTSPHATIEAPIVTLRRTTVRSNKGPGGVASASATIVDSAIIDSGRGFGGAREQS